MSADVSELVGHGSAAGAALHLLERDRVVDLPHPLTGLVGRTAHFAMIVERLRSAPVRLLTLTGPGGIGKTRLAIAAGEALTGSFDRIWFVSLATVTDAALVAAHIARRIGVRAPASLRQEDALEDFLRRRPTLLILDNLEQIPDVAGPIVSLLTHCPDLTILATSRATLRVTGEHVIDLPSLELPDVAEMPAPETLTKYEAVRLFLERVRGFQPDFQITPENAGVVANICWRLDGLPLAIELAAVRLKILPPQALLTRLTRQLDLLTGGNRDLHPHQQTMRNTIAWSYDLLSPREQLLFRRISVFAGSFDLQAAAEIAGDLATDPVFVEDSAMSSQFDVIDDVLALAENSLLRRFADGSDEPRFGMLATIREFGLEQLARNGELEAVRNRHAAYMLAFATSASRQLSGADQVRWMERFEQERANTQAAFAWLEETGQVETFIRLASALRRFWFTRGYFSEGRTWCEPAARHALADESIPAALRADALLDAGWLALGQSNLTEARRHAEASIALARQVDGTRHLARATGLLGMVVHRATDYTSALEQFQASLAYARQANDNESIAWALHSIATTTMDTGDLESARALLIEACALYNEAGNMHGWAQAIDTFSVVLYCLGEDEEAEALAQQALDVCRRVGDTRRTAVALDHVGKCARRRGNFRQSWACHAESLPLRREYGDPRGLAVWLEAVASLLADLGNPAQAAMTLGTTGALRESIGAPLYGNELFDYERVVSGIREAVGDAIFAERIEAGSAMSHDAAIELAIGEVSRLLEEASAAIATEAAAPFDLTPRELDVLRLVMQRSRDREIAEALQISPRTVARHLAGIFRKLGVQSRHDAAAKATEAGVS
jgi:predicted ATPase/DNA-binding CsgD family transcriptional regulator